MFVFERANVCRISRLDFGPVFARTSKSKPAPKGLPRGFAAPDDAHRSRTVSLVVLVATIKIRRLSRRSSQVETSGYREASNVSSGILDAIGKRQIRREYVAEL